MKSLLAGSQGFVPIFIVNLLTLVAMETMSDPYSCDADDAALTELFDEIQQCMSANKGISETIAKQNLNIEEMQLKSNENQRKLNEQYERLLEKINEIPSKLEKIEKRHDEQYAKLLEKLEKLLANPHPHHHRGPHPHPHHF